jgi:hypothetical protein
MAKKSAIVNNYELYEGQNVRNADLVFCNHSIQQNLF